MQLFLTKNTIGVIFKWSGQGYLSQYDVLISVEYFYYNCSMREKAILENETNQNPPKKQTRTFKNYTSCFVLELSCQKKDFIAYTNTLLTNWKNRTQKPGWNLAWNYLSFVLLIYYIEVLFILLILVVRKNIKRKLKKKCILLYVLFFCPIFLSPFSEFKKG